ncbi:MULTISPECIES: dTDP-4-dehydrorhamnose reductase [unclassified Leeuwenhoekiella]|uniref:dTDP-4-dehydrorhamnose reductase n=1 Tax=unclassified Leeuwenhoekiella TaxID=2615029 RepID=UPI000C5D50FB|nr:MULTISPECIES: dTDP-4-dehydrorhamnose reductase [unclassified Leeuwenhoekiella]MAW94827.1 dTDP-4-dehydrorhamnose reductase [Leeuwenhoekiella sp.]MBA79547.1 dTDP-4-dehydrorhamnose reductase [Leeuwenhoekiella sp.]|tara:strand:- start:7421 stop:8284 length:864 start_codon:yes stop_codon:yes gene_type:complete
MASDQLSVLVTGAGGQLAQCIQKLQPDFDYAFYFKDRKALNITDAASINSALDKLKPDVIINTAAYTQVDLAETETEQAFNINHLGVANLAARCAERVIKLIHISTDYVFDGKLDRPYLETDPTKPQTAYGKSKLAGEHSILEAKLPAFWILRTAWLYSIYGKNFYKTILNLAQSRDELSVVNDQTGAPTQALDLARFILENLPKLNKQNSGIYHYVNSGQATWFDFAKAIIAENGLMTSVIPVASSQYPTAARRPEYSVLANSKIQETFNFSIRHWSEALPGQARV